MRNPLTLEAFAAWCETKPEDEAFTYCDERKCACGQYAASLGLLEQWLYHPTKFWGDMDEHAFLLGSVGPRTFGALAARLRAAL